MVKKEKVNGEIVWSYEISREDEEGSTAQCGGWMDGAQREQHGGRRNLIRVGGEKKNM